MATPPYVVKVGANAYGNPVFARELAVLEAFPITRNPRFLYRAWSGDSQGVSGSLGFISAARHAGDPTHPLRESQSFLPDARNQLTAAKKATRHTTFHSPYVSLSSSLLLSLAWAYRKLYLGEQAIMVAVLDTYKASAATVIPASVLAKVVNACQGDSSKCLRDDGYDDEYLVYGNLRFEASSRGIHISALLEILQTTSLTTYLPTLQIVDLRTPWHAQLHHVRNTIFANRRALDDQSRRIVEEIVRGFPTEFMLPILVQMLSLRGFQTSKEPSVLSMLMSSTISPELHVDAYTNFLAQKPDEFPPLRAPKLVPELREEYALLNYMHGKFGEQQKQRAEILAGLREGAERLKTCFEVYEAKHSATPLTTGVLRAHFEDMRACTERFDQMVLDRLLASTREFHEHVLKVQEWDAELRFLMSRENAILATISGNKRKREEGQREGTENERNSKSTKL